MFQFEMSFKENRLSLRIHKKQIAKNYEQWRCGGLQIWMEERGTQFGKPNEERGLFPLVKRGPGQVPSLEIF